MKPSLLLILFYHFSEVAACEGDWLPFAKDEFAAYFAGKRQAMAAGGSTPAAKRSLGMDAVMAQAATGQVGVPPCSARGHVRLRDPHHNPARGEDVGGW